VRDTADRAVTRYHFAFWNLENLFTRPSARSPLSDDAGRKAIEDPALANASVTMGTWPTVDRTTLRPLSQRCEWHVPIPPRTALVHRRPSPRPR
jgi:hypothetical protein